MQPKLLLLTLLLSTSVTLLAQRTPTQQRPKCGTTFNLSKVLQDAGKARRYYENERRIQAAIASMRSGTSITATDDTITIPVVFHVVNFDQAVITDAMIYQQLEVLNRDYAGSNEDSINAPIFYPVRGRAKIKFELAKRSPRGCDTIGIERRANAMFVTSATVGQLKHFASGGLDAWESYNCHYLNIWIGTLTGGLLGKATFPDDTDIPQNEQGVVIDKSTLLFSYIGQGASDFIYGRTLVHEVGHFFYLRHIWGDDEDEPNTCVWSDLTDDTPNQAVATYGRPSVPLFDVCSPVGTSNGINYQNFMDYCDDTVLTMFSKKQVERILATLAAFPNRAALISKGNKALIPKEENQLFTQCNTAAFTTNNFTCVGVGKNGVVWAGSSQAGLYNYYGGQWHQYGSYINNLYQDIEADKNGGIWVAQSGYNGAQAQTGGMLYFPDSIFPVSPNYYSALAGMPSRYPRSVFVDTSRINVGQGGTINPLVWTANFATITAGVSSNGGLGRGFDPAAPNFLTIRDGLEPADVNGGTASCYVLGGNAAEIVVATQNNFGMSQLLRYNAITNAFTGTYDTTNGLAGLGLATNFVTRAVYFDRSGRLWVSVNGTGLLVRDNNVWKKISYPKIFPSSPFFNNNALSGDSSGNVYIGTTSGLIVYTGGQSLDKDSAFTLYNTSNGLPSNNIKHIAIDTMRKKLILATDAGVIFWNPVCAAGPAIDNESYSTTATGDWNNPAVWCNGVVPPPGAKIIVRHPVNITADANCKSLQLVLPGSFNVAPGVNFNVGP